MIEIIPYEDRFHEDFRLLNLEWLNKYHLTESHDLMVLDNPRGTIIDRGGCIFLAKSDKEIVGSSALMKEHDGVYELAKMAVKPDYRGQGISKLLIKKCLDMAKELNASKLILFSNSQLKTALSLYQKYGFRHVPVEDAPFLTADVKMELDMSTNNEIERKE
jgi:putative acetyltransferase